MFEEAMWNLKVHTNNMWNTITECIENIFKEVFVESKRKIALYLKKLDGGMLRYKPYYIH